MRIIPGAALSLADAEAVAAALVDEFGRVYPDWTVPQALGEVRNSDGLPQTLCAIGADGAVLGCASLLADDEVTGFQYAEAWLGNVWVDPAFRGRGVGSELVRAVLDLARSLGLTEVHLVTDTAADWYRDRGWRDVGAAVVHAHHMQCLRQRI